jgi:DNA-binding CsgD family transcriptional regulator
MSKEGVIFTTKEAKIFVEWLKGSSNADIARQLTVSPAYISKTLRNIRQKISKVRNTAKMLADNGLVELGPAMTLTDAGKKWVREEVEKGQLELQLGVTEREEEGTRLEPARLLAYPTMQEVRAVSNSPNWTLEKLEHFTVYVLRKETSEVPEKMIIQNTTTRYYSQKRPISRKLETVAALSSI